MIPLILFDIIWEYLELIFLLTITLYLKKNTLVLLEESKRIESYEPINKIICAFESFVLIILSCTIFRKPTNLLITVIPIRNIVAQQAML